MPIGITAFTWHDVRFKGKTDQVQLAFTLFYRNLLEGTSLEDGFVAFMKLAVSEVEGKRWVDDYGHALSEEGCHAFFLMTGNEERASLAQGTCAKVHVLAVAILKALATPGA